MELLDGETLGQRLARLGSIDPIELCQTLLPIIDALHFAHGHGVIHRDLKPDNVFIAKTDGGGVQPKLLDFGIAKLRGESPLLTTKLTQAGTLIGSPDYMSPEQARGETDLDPRSDVWALCVLAYECLVGKPPFYGDNYNALLWAIIHDEPVPITVFQAGDSELWRLLKTGFSKDRTARWENARRFGESLATWLDNHGIVEDICNRSLHATWLPAERPTRPELAPFDPQALSPQQRIPQQTSPHAAVLPGPHAALMPPPTLGMAPPATLAMVRRPHTGALWVAALGLLALLGAIYVTSEGDEDALAAEPEGLGTQVGKAALRVADPVVGQRQGSAPVAAPQGSDRPASNDPATGSPLAASPLAAAEPISGTASSSWTKNHEKTLKVRDLALAKDFKETVNGSESGKQRSTASRRSPAQPVSPAASPAPPRLRANPIKKAAADKNESAEVDFGI
jgi:serine/threonine-protein kinase